MRAYQIEREQDARAIAEALSKRYPSYEHRAVKPRGARLWRIGVYCRATGAFLQYAKM